MARYHINPATARAGICRAEKGNCPLTAEDSHFSTKEDAQRGIEAILSKEHGNINPITKKAFSKSYLDKRKRLEADKAAIAALPGILKRVEQRELDKPKTPFSQERELKREGNNVYFLNGSSALIKRYNPNYVEAFDNYSSSLNDFYLAVDRKDPALADYLDKTANALNKLPQDSREKQRSLLNSNLNSGVHSLGIYVQTVASLNNDYLNSYEHGTTNALLSSKDKTFTPGSSIIEEDRVAVAGRMLDTAFETMKPIKSLEDYERAFKKVDDSKADIVRSMKNEGVRNERIKESSLELDSRVTAKKVEALKALRVNEQLSLFTSRKKRMHVKAHNETIDNMIEDLNS